MNKAAFLEVIKHVSAISEQEVAELEKLALSFPYCQTAHLLLAKAAYDHGSMLSNQRLRRAAACAANRQLLKKLIYTSAAEVAISPITASQEPDPVSAEAFITTAPTVTESEIIPESSPAIESDSIIPAEALKENVAENKSPEPEVTQEEKEEINNIADDTESATLADTKNPDLIVSEVSENSTEDLVDPKDIVYPPAENFAASYFTEDQENQDSLFFIENLQPAAPYRDPVTDFISNLVGYGETVDPQEFEELTHKAEVNHPHIPEVSAAESFTEVTANSANHYNEELSQEELTDNLIQLEADQTIADFDEYLFRPEKEIETGVPAGIPFKEEIIYKIFSENELGYWLDSSRLGETLQLKDELTPAQPYYFQPELILEYSRQHDLETYLPPTEKASNRQVEIIDQFLKQNPKLKAMAHVKIKSEPMEDLSSRSTKIKKSVASETLANIMVKQGKIKKAIKIYEHLILKIPEKKAYFASQIEKLQKLT
jgi:hypothetical protein